MSNNQERFRLHRILIAEICAGRYQTTWRKAIAIRANRFWAQAQCRRSTNVPLCVRAGGAS